MTLDSITALAGLAIMGVAAYAAVKWVLRAGAANVSKSGPLTPQDLRVLEETTHRLMAELRRVTDECVTRIEQACREASIAAALLPSPPPARVDYDRPRLIDTVVGDESAASPTMSDHVLPGELQLMNGLRKIGSAGR